MPNAKLFIPPFESLTDDEYNMLEVVAQNDPEVIHEILLGNKETEELMYYHIVKKQPKNKNIQEKVNTSDTLTKWEQMALEYFFKYPMPYEVTASRNPDYFSNNEKLKVLPSGLYFTTQKEGEYV